MAPVFFVPNTPPLPLPPGHRFPAGKYKRLESLLLREGVVAPGGLRESPRATTAQLARAHDPAYIAAIADGTVDAAVMRRIGLPWSEVLAERSRATVGGSLAAAHQALRDGISGQLAGGTHHAHYAEGSGYCTFNDLAVAAHELFAKGLCRRVAILDTDVHQGDGNAALLADHPDVFVCSIHGAKNFPFRKVPSDLDFGLVDGTEDEAYLAVLDEALDAVAAFKPDLLFYLSGADPLAEDRLGRLALSFTGLVARDRKVMRFAARRGLPLSIAIGGGYAEPIDLSVTAYANTFRTAKEIYRF